MRTINITAAKSVELWPGRRLFIPDGEESELVKLPTGAARLRIHKNDAAMHFGSAERSTVTVTGRTEMIRALYQGIIDHERPSEGVKRIS